MKNYLLLAAGIAQIVDAHKTCHGLVLSGGGAHGAWAAAPSDQPSAADLRRKHGHGQADSAAVWSGKNEAELYFV